MLLISHESNFIGCYNNTLSCYKMNAESTHYTKASGIAPTIPFRWVCLRAGDALAVKPCINVLRAALLHKVAIKEFMIAMKGSRKRILCGPAMIYLSTCLHDKSVYCPRLRSYDAVSISYGILPFAAKFGKPDKQIKFKTTFLQL